MKEIVKIQYINKDDRDQASENIPEWKQKINKINLEFSQLISDMFRIFPHAASILANSGVDFGDPNDYAKLEVFNDNGVEYQELYHDFFHIDTQTLKITDPEVPGFTGCPETEWDDKYNGSIDSKLY